MITPEYCRVMAGYNAEMNRRLFAAAERLGEAARRQSAGAFWSTLHGTLNHILWADRMWMARLADGPPAITDMAGSPGMYADFETLAAERQACDAFMSDWAQTVDPDWLASSLTWRSAVLKRDVTAPVRLLVAHLFNHQTHHRGQAHTLITQAGEKVGDTDLFLVVPLEMFA
jgi:uncharacterized damage-inducible protein DinB